MTVVVEGVIDGFRERPVPGARWRRMVTATLSEGRAKLRLVWFNLPSYMRGRMPAGERVAVFGRVSEAPDGHVEIVQPEVRAADESLSDPIQPVYRLPEGVGQRLWASIVTRVVSEAAGAVRGAIPKELGANGSLAHELKQLHRPDASAGLRHLQSGRSPGHRAIAFDELFAFELAMCLERERAARRAGMVLDGAPTSTAEFVERLPF